MILVLLVICILLIFAVIAFVGVEWVDIIVLIPSIGTIACLIIALMLSYKIIEGRSLQAKIDMYEEENQRIENEISDIVNQYKVGDDVSGENALVLVDLYPELKSSEFVNQEIDTYMENNTKIKELKEDQIDIRTYKWWLYFGGKK
jgi:hypothetical protein